MSKNVVGDRGMWEPVDAVGAGGLNNNHSGTGGVGAPSNNFQELENPVRDRGSYI